MPTRISVAILLFDDVEVLDFAGPYEVFSRTRLEPGPESRRSEDSAPFAVWTVARTREPVRATGGLRVIPDHGLEDAPPSDVLVVPGGFGTRPLLEDERTLAWLRERAGLARHVTSVCTGALVLARLGLLAGRPATTHWCAHDLLASMDGTIDVRRDARVVRGGDGVVTSAGVAAGIDMAFALVEELCGPEVAAETARYVEFPRT